MSDLTLKKDEELVILSKEGNEIATDILFDRYKPLIKSKIKTYYLIGGDKDDIYQEGLIGFYKALVDYLPGEVSFSYFANLCITRRMQTAVRTANRKKHSPLNDYLSIDDQDSEKLLVASDVSDPQKLFISDERYRQLKDYIDSKLSDFEKQVFFMYIKDVSYADIAKATGKSRKSVDNAIQRIKGKLSFESTNVPK